MRTRLDRHTTPRVFCIVHTVPAHLPLFSPSRCVLSRPNYSSHGVTHGAASGARPGVKVLPRDCIPSAEELVGACLEAMAGAGDESRALAGPPRRPLTVTFSFRVAAAFSAGSKLLRKVGVQALLEPEASLRAACARNHTCITTGMPLLSVQSQQRDAVSMVGSSVLLHGLLSAPQLNGRSGTIVSWHAGKGRWLVHLHSADGPCKPG